MHFTGQSKNSYFLMFQKIRLILISWIIEVLGMISHNTSDSTRVHFQPQLQSCHAHKRCRAPSPEQLCIHFKIKTTITFGYNSPVPSSMGIGLGVSAPLDGPAFTLADEESKDVDRFCQNLRLDAPSLFSASEPLLFCDVSNSMFCRCSMFSADRIR